MIERTRAGLAAAVDNGRKVVARGRSTTPTPTPAPRAGARSLRDNGIMAIDIRLDVDQCVTKPDECIDVRVAISSTQCRLACCSTGCMPPSWVSTPTGWSPTPIVHPRRSRRTGGQVVADIADMRCRGRFRGHRRWPARTPQHHGHRRWLLGAWYRAHTIEARRFAARRSMRFGSAESWSPPMPLIKGSHPDQINRRASNEGSGTGLTLADQVDSTAANLRPPHP